MALRVVSIEPPGSPEMMKVLKLPKSTLGSYPCSMAFYPRSHAYDGLYHINVGWYCFIAQSRRALGTAPTHMPKAPSSCAPMTSGPPT